MRSFYVRTEMIYCPNGKEAVTAFFSFFGGLSLCLFLCLFLCVSLPLSVSLFLSLCLSSSLSVSLPLSLSLFLSLCLYSSLSVSLPLSLCLSSSLSVSLLLTCLSYSLSIYVCLSPHSSFLFFCTLSLRLMYRCNFNPVILKCKESSVMRYQVCHKALQFQFSCNFQLPCTTYLVYSD